MAFDAGDIETTLQLDRTPFNQGLDKAERDARAFERKKFKARIDVEVDQRQVDRDINRSTAGKRPKVVIDADIDKTQVAKKIDEIATNTEKTAARSGNRLARALLNPVMIQLGLLPGVAAVAAAGAGAALLLPVAAFAAWGVAAAKSSAEVKTAWASLKKEVGEGSKEIAGPVRVALVETINDARAAWVAAKPMFAGMFVDAAPHVRSFAGSLIGLVTNTLPGMNVALQRGEGFMAGWRTGLGLIGTGISDLVDNASRITNAEDAVANFGRTVQLLLGFVGKLVGMFGEIWGEIGVRFNGVLEQAIGLVQSFSDGALPAMMGGLRALLILLGGIAQILGPFMNVLGSGVGTILAVAAAYKILNLAMTGIGRAGTAVKTAIGNSTTAIGNATGGLALFSRGAKDATRDADRASEGQSRFAKAASGTAAVLGKVGNSLPIIGAAFVLFGSVVQAVEDDIAKRIAERNKKWEEQRDIAERSADRIRTSQDRAAASTLQYNKAVYEMGPASERAKFAQENLARATLDEKDAQEQAARATKTHTERLLDFFKAITGGLSAQVQYNNSVKDVKEKVDALAEAQKKHGKNSMDAKFASDELALAMANQVQAAADLVVAQNSNATEFDKLKLAEKAVFDETLKLNDVFGARMPASMLQTIAGLGKTGLEALGAKVTFDKLGNAIIETPEHRKITIDSNMWNQAEAALSLKQRVDNLPTGTKFLTYFIDTVVKGPGPGTAPFPIPGAPRNAYGTANWGGGWTWKDEKGPEFIQLPAGAKVFTNNRSRGMVHEEVRRALAETDGFAGGGGDVYHNTFNPPPFSDEEWLDRVTREVSRRQQLQMYQGR